MLSDYGLRPNPTYPTYDAGGVVPPGGVVVPSGLVVPAGGGVVASGAGVTGAGAVSAGGVAGVSGTAGVTVVAGGVATVSSRLLQPASSAQARALPRRSLLVVVNVAVMMFPFARKLRLDGLLVQNKAGIACPN